MRDGVGLLYFHVNQSLAAGCMEEVSGQGRGQNLSDESGQLRVILQIRGSCRQFTAKGVQ